MDYRKLKKLIKDITKKNPPQNDTHANSKENIDIMKSPDEVQFFKELKEQLMNASQFFEAKSKEMMEKCAPFAQELETLENEIPRPTDRKTEVSCFLRRISEYYRELLLFESFGVFNFYGFSKILKKHDRWTGYSTKEKFMENVVATHSFATQHGLAELLNKVKAIYSRANKLNNDLQHQEGCNVGESGKVSDSSSNVESHKASDMVDLEKARNLHLEAQMLCSLKKRPLEAAGNEDRNSSSDDTSSPRKRPATNLASRSIGGRAGFAATFQADCSHK